MRYYSKNDRELKVGQVVLVEPQYSVNQQAERTGEIYQIDLDGPFPVRVKDFQFGTVCSFHAKEITVLFKSNRSTF